MWGVRRDAGRSFPYDGRRRLINAYDFDKTIYRGDSTRDFYRHCLGRHPRLLIHGLGLIAPGIAFLCGRMEKTAFKQRFFGFLRHVPDVEMEVRLFWDRNEKGMRAFYMKQRQGDDLIVSASPEFLLRPLLDRIGVRGLIASRVDAHAGLFDGLNCYGEEKRIRLLKERPDAGIDAFYSDSLSDAPLAALAKKAYLVQGERVLPWPE